MTTGNTIIHRTILGDGFTARPDSTRARHSAEQMGFRLIGLDIDGTIRTADHPPSERTRRAIESAKEAGAVVTLVTGRMFRSAIAATSDMDITSPIVSFQGAHVANPKTGEVLHHLPLAPHMLTRALDALDGWPREILAYVGTTCSPTCSRRGWRRTASATGAACGSCPT